ncbi:MAG: hypothetical protein EXR51_11055 [Dehalococcoidia bacterium]|nr:hypothetical protein [Dehalococcoidia bacterium]
MPEAGDIRELPLFLLNTVLFPGMALPLKVFEPRYRQMMDDCMAGDKTFGVMLIKQGHEVGEPAVPHKMGTTALIEDIEPQRDGTLAVATEGVQRFALLEMRQSRPYPLGVVEFQGPDDAVRDGAMAEIVRDTGERVMRRLMALNHEWVRGLTLPPEPEELSYLLAARLPVEAGVKQRLLESNLTDRLRRTLRVLQAEERQIEQQLAERTWLRGALLN